MKATSGDSSGSTVATSYQNDAEYLAPVDVVGTTLNLDFDTGSADLYVPYPNELRKAGRLY